MEETMDSSRSLGNHINETSRKRSSHIEDNPPHTREFRKMPSLKKNLSKFDKDDPKDPDFYNRKRFYNRKQSLCTNAKDFDDSTNCEVTVIVHKKKDDTYFVYNTRGDYRPCFNRIASMETKMLKQRLTNWNIPKPGKNEQPLSKWALTRKDRGQEKKKKSVDAGIVSPESPTNDGHHHQHMLESGQQSHIETTVPLAGVAYSFPNVPGIRIIRENEPTPASSPDDHMSYTLLQPASVVDYYGYE